MESITAPPLHNPPGGPQQRPHPIQRLFINHSGYTLRNLGDAAMLRVCYQRCRQAFPHAEILIPTTEPARLAQHCPTAQPCAGDLFEDWLRQRIHPWPLRIWPRPLRQWLWHHELRNKFRRAGQAHPGHPLHTLHAAADAIVLSGGGFFNDSFPQQAQWAALSLRFAQTLGKPCAAFGQGLGPLHEPRLRTLVLPALASLPHLSLREPQSLETYQTWFPDQPAPPVTGDDALALTPPAHADPSPADCCGLNLRVSSYSGVDPDKLEPLRQALQNLLHQLSLKSFIPLPIDLEPTSGDTAALHQLWPGDAPLWAQNIPEISLRLDPLPAFWQRLARCRLVVTGSYHAAVFALAAGRPVLGLCANAYYQQKLDGLRRLFPERMRLKDLREFPRTPEWPVDLLELLQSHPDSPTLPQAGLVQSSTAAYEAFFSTLNAHA